MTQTKLAPVPYQRGSTLESTILYKGGLFSFLVKGDDSGGRDATIEYRAKPGNEPAPYMNQWEHETYYVLEGVMEFYCGDSEVMVVNAGEMVFLPQGKAHAFYIRSPHANHRTDGEIAAAAAHKIEWFTTIPKGTVEVTVRNGWIILEGEVEWWYQKNAAETVVRHLVGVHGVSNSISIKPTDKIPAVGMGIEAAIVGVASPSENRNGMLDASKIRVEIIGSKVILHGTVRTLAQREEAERIAWAAQGVFSVEDHLAVKWYTSGD